MHDLYGLSIFLLPFFAVMFFAPELGGYFLEWNNFIPADPLQGPTHIAPVWYFTPYYSILRATTEDFMYRAGGRHVGSPTRSCFTDARRFDREAARSLVAIDLLVFMIGGPLTLDPKFWGVVLMGVSVMIFFAMPWLDHSPVQVDALSARLAFGAADRVVVVFLILGYLGTQPPTPAATLPRAGVHAALLRILPPDAVVEPDGEFKPVPDRMTSSRRIEDGREQLKNFLVTPACCCSLSARCAAPSALAAERAIRMDTVARMRGRTSASLQNGARLFANYCLGCHGASMMRWNRLDDIGLDDKQIKEFLIFGNQKVGDVMRSRRCVRRCQKRWFGKAPPDLSVIARARTSSESRGPDYLFTLLRGYYRDASSPTGWNNVA